MTALVERTSLLWMLVKLLYQSSPKGRELSGYRQEQLDAIADEIDNRSREGLGVRAPVRSVTIY